MNSAGVLGNTGASIAGRLSPGPSACDAMLMPRPSRPWRFADPRLWSNSRREPMRAELAAGDSRRGRAGLVHRGRKDPGRRVADQEGPGRDAEIGAVQLQPALLDQDLDAGEGHQVREAELDRRELEAGDVVLRS